MKNQPKFITERVEEMWKDSDSWWVILKQGWVIDHAVGCREDTKSALMARIKSEARRGEER